MINFFSLTNKQPLKNRGFTVIEILVAIFIIGLTLTSLFSLYGISLKTTTQNKNKIAALNLASENLEITRAIRDDNWNNIASLTMGTNYHLNKNDSNKWIFIQGAETQKGFTRKVIIDNVSRDTNDNIVTSGGVNDLNTKKITSITTWQDQNITLTAYLTNWK